jgi:mannosyltransferase OCH1-like enzyme
MEGFLSSRFFAQCDFGTRFERDIRDIDRWELLASRYDSWLASSDHPKEAIPKIIHQIWIGGELPAKYSAFTGSWSALNPDFEYMLWTEESISAILEGRIAEIYQKTPNYGAKSDIARYVILCRHGGIYADTDFECLKPMSAIAERTRFFAGLTVDESPQLLNGIVGAAPGHPFIRALLDSISGPVERRSDQVVLDSTGPYFMSRLFFQAASATNEYDIVFPTRIFYPFPSASRHLKFADAEEIKAAFVDADAIAIHYWEVSWRHDESPVLRGVKNTIKRLIFWDKLQPALKRLIKKSR